MAEAAPSDVIGRRDRRLVAHHETRAKGARRLSSSAARGPGSMNAYRPTPANVELWLRSFFPFPVVIDARHGTAPLLAIAWAYSDLFRPIGEDDDRPTEVEG